MIAILADLFLTHEIRIPNNCLRIIKYFNGTGSSNFRPQTVVKCTDYDQWIELFIILENVTSQIGHHDVIIPFT